jgi:hypothetical protein
MNNQSLRTIFESSGNLRRLHLPQEYTLLERYIERGVIQVESYKLEAAHCGIQEQLNTFLGTQRWDEIEIVRSLPQLAMISNGGGRIHNWKCLFSPRARLGIVELSKMI